MTSELISFLPELISVSVIAIFMAISPGADFVMVTRNSIFGSRKAGLYSAVGISLAIWFHVAYSIAGLALLISQSIVLFSILKYLGAAYLIYIGWKTFRSNTELQIEKQSETSELSKYTAFKLGFITNLLNPKTTIFFLSIFTQVVDGQTPLWVQIVYGAIISFAHLLWFSCVSMFFGHPKLLAKFFTHKVKVEKVVGTVLMGFGLKVAMATSP